MTSPSAGRTVFLAPPSPPFAPHLGTAYTWCLLDAVARSARREGSSAVLPESWTLSGRRLDQLLGEQANQHELVEQAVDAAVRRTRRMLSDFGIVMTIDPPVRDDDPVVRSFLREAVAELAQSGVIRRVTVAEKWCDPCGISLPETASREDCFACGMPLAISERPDWFLLLDMPGVFRQAAQARWLPAYALRRFQALADIRPQVRVGHFGRATGVPSPLDERQKLDPRLVTALYPRMLRALGYDRIVTAAGQDIQRKWLVLAFATSDTEPAIDTVINHGVLLADGQRKMSRYEGAAVSDLPAATDPIAYRAAMLASSLGRDIVASSVAFEDASRLRAKIINVVRFLQAQPVSRSGSAISLETELDAVLDEADELLSELDLSAAYRALRRCVRAELSHRLIPLIRVRGCRDAAPVVSRVLSLATVFYGDGLHASHKPASGHAPTAADQGTG